MTSTPPSASYQLFVGIDIAAKTFTATWISSVRALRHRPITLDQTPYGFSALQQQLAATNILPAQTLIVVEATGSYWVTLAVTLHTAGYQVSIANPAHIHSYAKSLARRAKTDLLDAALLAGFAMERQPAPWSPPPAIYHELRQRLVVRETLLTTRQQLRNQRHALIQWPVVIDAAKTHLDDLIDDFDERIDQLEADLATLLADGAWAESANLLQSIPGIGVITTSWLLVGTLNLSLCASAEAATAYVGLAPMVRESGSSLRGRATIGHAGHDRLRTALYLATLSAARANPVIKGFYDRLVAAGKHKKVARCAAARKLLHIAWAVVKSGKPFDPYHTQQTPP